MIFWLTLFACQATWFAAVIGAGHGLWWPGVLATVLFTLWRGVISPNRRLELRLIAAALALGVVLENLWVASGLLDYAVAWPWAGSPAWILALWWAFALAIVPLFGYLRNRLGLATVMGAIGGPLAYLGAARGWDVVRFAEPAWTSLLALGAGWAVAMPLLVWLSGSGVHGQASGGRT